MIVNVSWDQRHFSKKGSHALNIIDFGATADLFDRKIDKLSFQIAFIPWKSEVSFWLWLSFSVNTAVSRKVILQTRKSLRDNVESYYGWWCFLRLLLWTSRCFSMVEGNSTNTYLFFLVPCCWIAVNLIQANRPNSYYLKCKSALSRTVLHFRGTTFAETAVCVITWCHLIWIHEKQERNFLQ